MAELATPASDHPSEQSSDQQLSSDDANSEAETEASDSDDTDELLAQLSQSMWASLRPETHAQQSQEPPSTSGRGDQELNNDHSHAPSTRLHHAAGTLPELPHHSHIICACHFIHVTIIPIQFVHVAMQMSHIQISCIRRIPAMQSHLTRGHHAATAAACCCTYCPFIVSTCCSSNFRQCRNVQGTYTRSMLDKSLQQCIQACVGFA